jgi:hypothetical protein
MESGYSRQTGCIVSEEGNGELTAEKNPGRCSAGGFFAADSTDWRGFFLAEKNILSGSLFYKK